MKNGIWQVHWLDLLSINLCAKFYRNIPFGSRVIAIFAVTILASALPQSMKSGIWQFLWLDLVNNNVYIKFYQHPMWLISIFSHFGLGIASVNEKWHLTSPLARSSQHQSVCKILSKYSFWFKSYGHFCCHIFGLSIASVNEKWHLAIPLTRSCQ